MTAYSHLSSLQYKMELVARMCVMAALLGFGTAQLTNMEKALVVNRLLRLQEQQDIMGRNSQVAEVSNNTLRDCLAYSILAYSIRGS